MALMWKQLALSLLVVPLLAIFATAETLAADAKHKTSSSAQVSEMIKRTGRGSAQLLLHEMQDLIKSKGKTGIDPEEQDHIQQIRDAIDAIIIPGIQDEVADMVDEIEVLYQAILQCQADFEVDYEVTVELEKGVHEWKETHEECREKEEFWYKEKVKECTEHAEFQEGIHIPADMPRIDGSDEDLLAWLDLMSDYFCPLYETWEEHWEECVETEKNYTKLVEECTEIQTEHEERFCNLKVELEGVCKEYNDCWDNAVDIYNNRKTALMELIDQLKKEYESSVEVKCLWDSWIYEEEPCTVNETKVKECYEIRPNTTNISITWPPLPDPEPCDLAPVEVYPCQEAWESQEYVSMGLDPVILQQMKDNCKACNEFLAGEETALLAAEASAEFNVNNMQVTGSHLFTKQSGEAYAYDAWAVSSCKHQVTSLSFKAASTHTSVIVGLTSNPDDSKDFEHGEKIELLPDQKLVMGEGKSHSYRQGDEFSLLVEGDTIKAMKHNKIVKEWKGSATRPYLYPKIWIYDKGAHLSLSHVVPASDPQECN